MCSHIQAPQTETVGLDGCLNIYAHRADARHPAGTEVTLLKYAEPKTPGDSKGRVTTLWGGRIRYHYWYPYQQTGLAALVRCCCWCPHKDLNTECVKSALLSIALSRVCLCMHFFLCVSVCICLCVCVGVGVCVCVWDGRLQCPMNNLAPGWWDRWPQGSQVTGSGAAITTAVRHSHMTFTFVLQPFNIRVSCIDWHQYWTNSAEA